MSGGGSKTGVCATVHQLLQTNAHVEKTGGRRNANFGFCVAVSQALKRRSGDCDAATQILKIVFGFRETGAGKCKTEVSSFQILTPGHSILQKKKTTNSVKQTMNSENPFRFLCCCITDLKNHFGNCDVATQFWKNDFGHRGATRRNLKTRLCGRNPLMNIRKSPGSVLLSMVNDPCAAMFMKKVR